MNPIKKPMFQNVPEPSNMNLDYNIPSEINVCIYIVKDQLLYGNVIRKILIQYYQNGLIKSFTFERPQYVKVEKKYYDNV